MAIKLYQIVKGLDSCGTLWDTSCVTQLLVTKGFGHKFQMLMTDLSHCSDLSRPKTLPYKNDTNIMMLLQKTENPIFKIRFSKSSLS